jgi:hypothetical protein
VTENATPLPGSATDADLAAGRAVVECRECHRPLSDPAARLLGWGEDCALKLGIRSAPRPNRFPAAQDGLFDG